MQNGHTNQVVLAVTATTNESCSKDFNDHDQTKFFDNAKNDFDELA